MMSNHLVVIGPIGDRRCYLNVSRDEAVQRYIVSEGVSPDPSEIFEMDFVDEFRAYTVFAGL